MDHLPFLTNGTVGIESILSSSNIITPTNVYLKSNSATYETFRVSIISDFGAPTSSSNLDLEKCVFHVNTSNPQAFRVLKNLPNCMSHTVTFTNPHSNILIEVIGPVGTPSAHNTHKLIQTESHWMHQSQNTTTQSLTLFFLEDMDGNLMSPNLKHYNTSSRALIDLTTLNCSKCHILTFYFSISIKWEVLQQIAFDIIKIGPQTVINAHENMWTSLWSHQIKIHGASQKLQDALERAMFDLHSSVDEHTGEYMLINESMIHEFIPAMILLKPNCATRILTQQSLKLDELSFVTAAKGALGAEFQEHSEITVESFTIKQVNRQSPLTTLMTGINAWNLYRTQKNVKWLENYGYKLIESAANYICSIAEPGEQYTWHIKEDHVITLGGSIALLKSAIEASAVLSIDPPRIWSDVRYGLNIEYVSPHVIGSLSENDPFDPLFILLEPLGSLIESDVGINLRTELRQTFQHWKGLKGTVTTIHNQLRWFHATLQSIQSQLDNIDTDINSLDSQLNDILSFEYGHDSSLMFSIHLLYTFLCGLTGVMIVGGVSESGREYQSFQILQNSSCVMPSNWESIDIFTTKGKQQLLNRSITQDLQVNYYNNSNYIDWNT